MQCCLVRGGIGWDGGFQVVGFDFPKSHLMGLPCSSRLTGIYRINLTVRRFTSVEADGIFGSAKIVT